MAKLVSSGKQKWWLHAMAPENIPELSPNDRKNAKRLNHWLLIWGLMFFWCRFRLDPIYDGVNTTPVWRLVLVFSPLILGVFLIHAFICLFRNTKDELANLFNQKIEDIFDPNGFSGNR